MSKPVNVEKATPTTFYAKKAPYSSLSNDVVAMITNPDALAIWVYLQTRSSDWKVIGSHLQDRFNIGRDRYRKAMGFLKDIGLLSHEITRDEGSGMMLGKRIIVHYEPNIQVSEHSVDRTFGLPSGGKTTPYLIKDSITKSIDQKPTVANAPSTLKPKAQKFDPLTVKPENVDPQVWADWCQHRKEIRKPLTATTCAQQAKKLAGHQAPNQVLETSIANGWSGIFPDKVLNSTAKAPSSRHNGFSNKDYTVGLKQREDGTYAL